MFNALNREFHFTLDAAARPENAKCAKWYGTQSDGSFVDGLKQIWRDEIIWLNPPYRRRVIDDWVRKAYSSALDYDTTIVMLLPARTDVDWWNRYCVYAHHIRFVEGRIKFEQEGKSNAATFPSAIVVFNGIPQEIPYTYVTQWKQPQRLIYQRA